MRLLLVILFILMGQGAMAQDQAAPKPAAPAPIFITPYALPDNGKASRMPSMVKSQNYTYGGTSANTQRTAASPYSAAAANNRVRSSHNKAPLRIVRNPFEGTGFGRMRAETDLYDPVTKKKYNQYEYMGMLAQRGDTAKLQETVKYIQENGVFNPAKYNATIQAAMQQKQAQQTTGVVAPPTAKTTADGRPRVFVQKNQGQSDTPQKIHNDYDGAAPASGGNRPIFLSR